MIESCLTVESGSRSWLINILNGEIVEIGKNIPKKNEEEYQTDGIEDLKLKEKGFYLIDEKAKLEETKNKLQLTDNITQKIHKKVNFVITYNCNFRCPYCFEKIDKENQKIISRNIIDTVYQYYGRKIEYIGLFGGEPLLNESREIIEYIYEKWPDAIYDISTNGYNIDKFIDILNKMKIDSIQVTLDGSREKHNKSRIHKNGDLTFDKIVDNIKLLLQNNIKTFIRMNVDQYYIDEVFAQKERLENLFDASDLLTFNIGPLVQLSEADEERVETLLYEAEAKDKKKSENWDISKGNRYIVNGSMPILKKVLYDIPFRNSFTYCPANTNALFFDADNEIYSCAGLVGNPKYSIGKVIDNKILYAQENMFRKNIINQNKCSKCKYALLCGGGCQMSLQSRRCNRTKYMINKILPMILDILY